MHNKHSNSIPSELNYRPSIIAQLGKKFLLSIENYLPPPYYDKLYTFTFDNYRKVIRLLYLRRWLRYALKSDYENCQKVQMVHKIMPYSLVGWQGLEVTYNIVIQIHNEKVKGDIVECGVAQGGCAGLMAMANNHTGNNRQLWLFDSFEGYRITRPSITQGLLFRDI